MLTATSKSVPVAYLPPITSPAAMVEVLLDALQIGYYGNANVNDAGEWWVNLSGPGQERIEGRIGDVFTWNGQSLSVLSIDAFNEQNETT